jgi:multisubunit Na+/H+ antiporter MnhB subunit
MKKVIAVFVVIALTAFALVLIVSMLDLPDPAVDLKSQVTANLRQSGAENPVTAVLLNFRGYDTLLEIAVLLLAVFGILAVGIEKDFIPATQLDPVLPMLARIALPFIIITAVYLLWAGSFRPGGAFQAGAVLAGGAVLLHLVGLLPHWGQPRSALRWGMAGGFLLFLCIAVWLLTEGNLLKFPASHAGLFILLIESGLTISLSLILSGLFLFLSCDNGGEK